MKVAMPIGMFHPALGGTEAQARLQAGALANRGVEVEVLTQRKQDWPAEESLDGFKVTRLPSPDWRVVGKYIHLASMAGRLARSDWDVAHAHGGHGHAWAAVRAGRKLGRPVVVKFGNTGERFDPKVLEGWFARGRTMAREMMAADRFIVLNRAMRDAVLEWGVPESKLVEIPNAVDVERFRPASAEEKLRLREELRWPSGFIVVMVASLLEKKNPALAVDAFKRLSKGSFDASLFVAGEGPLLPSLRSGAPSSIRFLGPRTDVDKLLRAADAFVLPSKHEGQPNAMLEAMACGLICLGSDIPPHRELLANGAGLAFAQTSEALEAALKKVICDGGLAANLALNARAAVEKKHALGTVADRLLALYEELLARRRA